MRRLRPRRISRSSGATFSSKKSGPTPIAAAASGGVNAKRGIDTASFRVTAQPDDPGALIDPLSGNGLAHHTSKQVGQPAIQGQTRVQIWCLQPLRLPSGIAPFAPSRPHTLTMFVRMVGCGVGLIGKGGEVAGGSDRGLRGVLRSGCQEGKGQTG